MSEKKIPNLRFKGFNGEWEEKRIGDIADVKRGSSPRPINDPKYFDKNSKIGWLRIANIKSFYLSKTTDYLSEIGCSKTNVIDENNLIMSICGTLGKTFINKIKIGLPDSFVCFLNLKLNMLFFHYLMYDYNYLKLAQQGTQFNLNSSLINSIKILFPSKFEQQKIADFFSKIDNLISLYERKLEILKASKKYYLSNMFPKEGKTIPELRFKGFDGEWEEKRLDEVTTKMRSGGTPLVTKREYYDGEIPFLSISDFNGKFLSKTKKFVSNLGIENSSSYIVNKNNLLLSIYATIGKPIITKIDVAIPQSILGIFFKDGYNKNFFYQFFLTKDKWFASNKQQGTQSNLSLKTISSMLCFIPSQDEQQKIADFFSKFDETIKGIEQKIENLKQSKKYYLQNMFI